MKVKAVMANVNPDTEQEPPPPTRIMLVEDEAIIAMDLCHRLETFGYQVVATAVSGAQALERIAAARPDLVMMDIMIKGPIDGIVTAELLQKEQRVPVVFLSANSDEATVRRARAAGAYGYLTKPFRPEEVRASIEVALVKARMEAQLRQSEQWFAKTLHCISDAVIATDSQGVVRFINPVAERLTGWSHQDARDRRIEEIVQAIDATSRKPVTSPIVEALRDRQVVLGRDTALLVSQDGTEVAVDEGAAPIVDDDDNLMGAVLVFRDITRRRQVERELRESEERFHSAFDNATVGMALMAIDGLILQNNRSIAEMLGFQEGELTGQNLHSLSHPDDLDGELDALRALIADQIPAIHMEQRFIHRAGHPVWALLSVSLVRGEDQTPLYCIIQLQDLTARKRAEERLTQMAHHDQVTGLVNRAHLIELAGHAIAMARRRGEMLGLFFIDLDGFKTINDTLGHKTGDQVLNVTAKRLRKCLRESDIIGRWGGDEFVAVVQGPGTEEHLALIAGTVLRELSQPLSFDGEDAAVTASIGIGMFPRDGHNVDSLVVSADAAMYQAKDYGKNQFCFAGRDSTPAVLRQFRLENQLRHAVERQELCLHYQPVVHRGRIDSVEALLRWQHPEHGLLAPSEFLPIAEKSGLIVPIGAWVLRTACAQARRWRDAGQTHLRIAVNVSARQMRSLDFLSTVAEALAHSKLEPDALELELTESWIMGDIQHSTEMLKMLRAMGVLVTVDDFGYSGLAYLQRLPLYRLKIDRSFLQGVPGDAHAEAIVRGIVSLARELNLDVVAEGVETQAQRQFLLAQGVMFVQGFAFYHPMAPETLDAAIQQQENARIDVWTAESG